MIYSSDFAGCLTHFAQRIIKEEKEVSLYSLFIHGINKVEHLDP